MVLKILLYLFLNFLCAFAYLDITVPPHKQTLDPGLFEDVLDEQLCHEQMSHLNNNNTELLLRLCVYFLYEKFTYFALRVEETVLYHLVNSNENKKHKCVITIVQEALNKSLVLDAGSRIPSGLLDGNLADFGNYYQCLAINQETPSIPSAIEGKFCMINLPLSQDLDLPSLPEWPEWPEWPDLPWPDIPWPQSHRVTPRLSDDVQKRLILFHRIRKSAQIAFGGQTVHRIAEDSPLSAFTLFLARCIPKSCTTKQAMSELLFNTTEIGLTYEDAYCRLPNDKQWVAADYIAIAVFSFLGLLVIASTGYDVHQTVVLGNDPKRLSKIYTSFSVYTNTRRLVTYTPVPGAIECLDGIRSFAMMWVIIGHTFVNQVSDILANPMDVINWIMSPGSIWVTMGPITVDTFFMLSGLLLVYTTAGKMSRSRLMKNLHMFYLNRLLRMFPLLAAFVLIQASILNRVSDGPNWGIMEEQTHRCRVYWWSTLLHVQNWVNPAAMCLSHSWYLAIDVQLYIISPLVLFWVLGKKKAAAWIALATGLILSLVGASIYNFIMEFQPGPLIPSRDEDSQSFYLTKYYVNTLTRASPFFVGMIYGYVLHLYRNEKIRIRRLHAFILWACCAIILAAITYIAYPIMQLDWDNQIMDSLINSYMRPGWALAVGWIIFACHNGIGGPINWVLSLRCFKVLGRLSYAMYIVHYPLIFMVNSSVLAPQYFSVSASLFKFLADFTFAAIVAYLLTLLVDSPCSTLIKHFMGGGQRKPRPAKDLTIESAPRNGIANQSYLNDETKNNSRL